MTRSRSITKFARDLSWEDIPDAVQGQARRCLLDTLGAAIGGRRTALSQIIYDHAATVYGGSGARLWLDGRQVSPPGAALANGMTIDSLDVHDGHALTKGHAGAAVVPAALATLALGEKGVLSGRELLVTLIVGYEVAIRAGMSLHATSCDYHTSGAWNALGCAAVIGRRLGLSHEQMRHALGIAEYHGPRSQMMRCIDHPTMVKDGSGWGAMAGLSAGLLAHGGFTGAPALTVESLEANDFWADLGSNWLISEQYFKPYAVCRWAQPAIVGALQLRQEIDPDKIKRIRVRTFHEAARLRCRHPRTTEEAQYSLPFPIAAALVHQQLGPAELSGVALNDPLVLRLSDCVELEEDPGFSAQFPAKRFALVQIETVDGAHYDSGAVEATWGEEAPPTDDQLREKFRWLANSYLSDSRVAKLEETIWHCSDLPDAAHLLDMLAPPG